MSHRRLPPVTLRDFQREGVEALARGALHAAREMRRTRANRRRVFKEVGAFLLEAPTGAGKTVMLAAVCEAISAEERVAWFWFAPFSGLVEQTSAALRRAAPGLRSRDPVRDRATAATRSGDVFVATWGAVAARRTETRRMRQDDDRAEALDTLVERLRETDFLIGAVVDEAHHGFREGTEAFRFIDAVLRPDLLFLATATPDDGDVERVQRSLDVRRFHRVSVSRQRVVAARLNKSRVLAISFVARGVSRGLVDLNEVALEKAVEHHRALKRALAEAGVPVVPLLLVQARSEDWTPTRARDLLRGRLGFPENAVAVHTAAEPDPDLMALANDPGVEVLVFKMAVATGFDAPRAATLCALRPVRDAGCRLTGDWAHHARSPCGARFADAARDARHRGGVPGRPGRASWPRRGCWPDKAIRDGIRVATDTMRVFQAEVGGGVLTLRGEDGQVAFDLSAPELENPAQRWSADWAEGEETGSPAKAEACDGRALQPARGNRTLFGELMEKPTPAPATLDLARDVQPSVASAFTYPRRADVPVPVRLRTERMPADTGSFLDALVRNVRFGPEEFAAVTRNRVEVERREADVFDVGTPEVRRAEQAAISDLFARESAMRALRISDHIDPAGLAQRLLAALRHALERDGQTPPEEKALRRGLNVILARNPRFCRDALKRTMAAHVEVVDAADLPLSLAALART